MVIFSTQYLFKRFRLTIRNQYSDYFNDYDILRIGKTFFQERLEYKFGIIGFQFVLMIFKK